MALLIIGIVVFLGIHLVPTLPQVRDGLIRRFGENGYKIFFSLLSTAGFVLLVWGFHRAPVVQIWSPPDWTRYMAMALTLPAFILIKSRGIGHVRQANSCHRAEFARSSSFHTGL